MTELEYYLEKARTGEIEAAFHGLLELPGDRILNLLDAFRVESDPVVREMIVRVISALGSPDAIEFLGTALNDRHPEVWKSALDGLVSNASPISRQAVERAKDGTAIGDPERAGWLAEAINQINETLIRPCNGKSSFDAFRKEPGKGLAMTLGDGQDALVTYDLASLTFTEVLRAHLRGKFPAARYPILRWVSSVFVLALGLTFLGFILGMAVWPRFRVETMAITFATAGAIVPVFTLTRLQRAVNRLRREGHCTTELSPEGILRGTQTRECKYRWIPGQRFLFRGDEVLIFLGSDEILWLPRRAFGSTEKIDSFLRAARSYHANAMNRR
jgi:hypothetical protein